MRPDTTARDREWSREAPVGALIRGLSVSSLSNEVLAELITSAASVTVKKVVESFVAELMELIVTDREVLEEIDKRQLLNDLRVLHRAGQL